MSSTIRRPLNLSQVIVSLKPVDFHKDFVGLSVIVETEEKCKWSKGETALLEITLQKISDQLLIPTYYPFVPLTLLKFQDVIELFQRWP